MNGSNVTGGQEGQDDNRPGQLVSLDSAPKPSGGRKIPGARVWVAVWLVLLAVVLVPFFVDANRPKNSWGGSGPCPTWTRDYSEAELTRFFERQQANGEPSSLPEDWCWMMP